MIKIHKERQFINQILTTITIYNKQQSHNKTLKPR